MKTFDLSPWTGAIASVNNDTTHPTVAGYRTLWEYNVQNLPAVIATLPV